MDHQVLMVLTDLQVPLDQVVKMVLLVHLVQVVKMVVLVLPNVFDRSFNITTTR
jgi:hypothetical protein